MPTLQKSVANKSKHRGGSAASDAVVKLVPAGTFEEMNRVFSNEFGTTSTATAAPATGGAKRKTGGAPRRKTPPKVDVNASASRKMLVHNKKGGSTSIGKMDPEPYKIPQSLPDVKSGFLSSTFIEPNPAVVPYPQHDLASRPIETLDAVSGGASRKAKSNAKSKAKSKKA